MGLLTDVHGRGVIGSRPAAGHAGREYYATDTTTNYRDNGSSWDAQSTGGATDLDALITASSGQDIADALAGAAAPDAGNVFATMADIGGGGGLAQSFIGYNTIGGTWTGVTAKREYMTKVTLAAARAFQSIDVYTRPSTDNVTSISVAILLDTAGAPDVMLAASQNAAQGLYLSNSGAMPGAGRWLSIPIGAYLPAGDYWLAVMFENTNLDIANDGSGSDRHFTSSVYSISGAYPSAFAVTTTALHFSIRASVLG